MTREEREAKFIVAVGSLEVLAKALGDAFEQVRESADAVAQVLLEFSAALEVVETDRDKLFHDATSALSLLLYGDQEKVDRAAAEATVRHALLALALAEVPRG